MHNKDKIDSLYDYLTNEVRLRGLGRRDIFASVTLPGILEETRGGSISGDLVSLRATAEIYIKMWLTERRLTKEDLRYEISYADPYGDIGLSKHLKPAITALGRLANIHDAQERRAYLYQCRDNPLLRDIFKYAMDWRLVYGAEDEYFHLEPHFSGPSPSKTLGVWRRFIEELDHLTKTTKWSESTLLRVRNIVLSMPKLMKRWAIRIAHRDLEIDLTARDVSKVWPKLVPTFRMASTYDFNSAKMSDRIWIEPLLEGDRAAIIVQNASRSLGSVHGQNGWGQKHLTYLTQELMGMMQNKGINSGVLDGIRLPSGKFVAFDWLEVDEFVKGISHTPQHARKTKLKQLLGTVTTGNIRYVAGYRASGKERNASIRKALALYRDAFRGVVVKNASSSYRAASKNSGAFQIKAFERSHAKVQGIVSRGGVTTSIIFRDLKEDMSITVTVDSDGPLPTGELKGRIAIVERQSVDLPELNKARIIDWVQLS